MKILTALFCITALSPLNAMKNPEDQPKKITEMNNSIKKPSKEAKEKGNKRDRQSEQDQKKSQYT